MMHKSIVSANTHKSGGGMDQKHLRAQLADLVAHDLKNPLNVIVGNMLLLLVLEDVPPNVKRILRSTLGAAGSVHRMTMNLIDIWKSEEAPIKAEILESDLGLLIDEVLESLRLPIEKGQKTVHVDVPYDAGRIRVDPELMRRVIENLVDNALKHTSRGGQVRIEARRSVRGVSIRVRDDGPSISDKACAVLFEKYAPLDSENREARAAAGLGLWFCRIAVEAHGGRIWADNDEPVGRSFWIELPRA
jgi:K+-sensing histidine kinase KdpD